MRLLAAVAIGLAAALITPIAHPGIGKDPTDFMWSIFAARDLVAGRDVYAQASHFDMIPYPLPAAIIALPLAPLPMKLGASLFMGISSGLLAYGLTRDGEWWRLLTFASGSYYSALQCCQWSPLMVAILCYPALMPLALAKPQYLLPLLPSMNLRRLLACFALGALSLAVDPTWPARWLGRVGPYGGFVPILVCPLLAVSALRRQWRHLLLVAAMPQHRYLYDSLMLWTLPRNRSEMLLLTLASWLTYGVGFAFVGLREHGDLLTTFGIYLPALAILVARELQLRTAAA